MASGIVSACFYPASDSYALLAATGISGDAAPVALYVAAVLDFALGLATLTPALRRRAAYLQIAATLGYSIILSVALPQLWLHPFGPLTKNLPLLAATAVMLALERR